MDLTAPSPNSVTTPSGLIVPESALTMASERWPESDIRKVRRAMKVLREHGLGWVFVCMHPQCMASGNPLVMQTREVDAQERDVTVLTCRHTERRVVGTL